MSWSVGSSRRRSSGSEVTTACPCCRAQATTEAPTISLVRVVPQIRPASRARTSSRGSTATSSVSTSFASRACRLPSRHACASAPAGMTIAMPRARAPCRSNWIRRSPRAMAISAPASRVRPFIALAVPRSCASASGRVRARPIAVLPQSEVLLIPGARFRVARRETPSCSSLLSLRRCTRSRSQRAHVGPRAARSPPRVPANSRRSSRNECQSYPQYDCT